MFERHLQLRSAMLCAFCVSAAWGNVLWPAAAVIASTLLQTDLHIPPHTPTNTVYPPPSARPPFELSRPKSCAEYTGIAWYYPLLGSTLRTTHNTWIHPIATARQHSSLLWTQLLTQSSQSSKQQIKSHTQASPIDPAGP